MKEVYKVVPPIIQSYVFIVSLLNPTVTYLLCFLSFYCILSLCVAIENVTKPVDFC